MEGAQGGRSRFENLIGPIPAVPGLKFHPTNEEVINFYLQNKIAGNLVWIDPIRTDQDIISRHPGTLQAHYPLLPLENAWWFYTTRDSKYPNNSKPKIERAEGYWKVSKGSDPIGDVGFKRVLNFREGSLKLSSTPTDWYMEEYSIKQFAPNKEDENWIIARIYQPLRRSQLISAGSLSPDLEVEDISLYFDWNNGGWSGSGSGYPFEPLGSGGTEVNGEWSGSAYYLPLDSGEGIISGSAYPFQPPGSGGTGTSTSAFPSPWCTPASGLSTSGS
ncbi:hypothetical protein RHGRI_010385 [Rhododendron griersonianum]|uniref:NAC domain-containing protein n=1 Tax=Rhododendron griersonianum TaxID=479676 RepID=A0AAV6KJE5_9ERIC|nr:hypothetical protein RHGRI_010385 [Rhododendron griersonianum]